ncbi:cytosolic protein [bacterium]|nr:cytosolic protein [bacterium]
MNQVLLEEIIEYVEHNIGSFHSKRLQSLENLKLDKILKRKNPYLFKAKNILTAQDFVKTLLDAHLSSQEETIFGDFLEGLAIFINEKAYGGHKSSAEGIDLEFEKEGIWYILSIKSGPNWGNSSQIRKMIDNFKKAKKILRSSNSKINVNSINGCCYGRDNKPDKGEYFKLCGQRFWSFISDNDNLYTDIIEPLGHKAKRKNEEFIEAYAQILNNFTQEFIQKYCDRGKINWKKLVQFNSEI